MGPSAWARREVSASAPVRADAAPALRRDGQAVGGWVVTEEGLTLMGSGNSPCVVIRARHAFPTYSRLPHSSSHIIHTHPLVTAGLHLLTMSYVAKDKDVDAGAQAQIHKIRITLTSRNVKNLEKGR